MGEGRLGFWGATTRLLDAVPFNYFLYVRVAFVVIMSTDADRAAAEKLEAEKKAAAASAWPTEGYNSFIPLLFITVLFILMLCVDVSTVSVVCACITEYQHVFISVNVMLVICLWIKLIKKLPIYSTGRT